MSVCVTVVCVIVFRARVSTLGSVIPATGLAGLFLGSFGPVPPSFVSIGRFRAFVGLLGYCLWAYVCCFHVGGTVLFPIVCVW